MADSLEVHGFGETEQTKMAVEMAKKHPFEFGFRHAFVAGKKLSLDSRGNWNLEVDPVAVNDPVWRGNCVDDASLTSAYLREHVGSGANVTIQKLYAKGVGNSPIGTDHYRVVVEHHQPPASILEDIDHSPFHEAYLNPENTGISQWRDISPEEESGLGNLNKGAIPVKDIAYCEFEAGGAPSLAYFDIENKPEAKVVALTFHGAMAGLPKGKADEFVTLNVPVGKVDKTFLRDQVTKMDASALQPQFGEQIKPWFHEVIQALPEEIKLPPST